MTDSITEIVIEDLRRCCRVCLEEPHLAQMLDMNVIYDDEEKLTYYDCYEICTKEDLRLCSVQEPNTICKHCAVELQWAYDFHKKAALTSKQLKIMLTIEPSEPEDEAQLEEDNNSDAEKQSLTPEKSRGDLEFEESSAGHLPSKVDALSIDFAPRPSASGPICCQFCQKEFRNHSHMLKHQIVHLSDRPHFLCNACDRSYLTKQALKVHVDTMHKKSGSNCTICGKVFARAKTLEVHMRYHKGVFPFKCDQCDRKFAQRSHLTVHQQVQHSSARFLCEFAGCGKLFTSSSALRNHECTHTEMPFECNVCQQGFPARYKLRHHAKVKHGMQLTLEQLEAMRKFYIMRSKLVLAQPSAIPEGRGGYNE